MPSLLHHIQRTNAGTRSTRHRKRHQRAALIVAIALLTLAALYLAGTR